MRCTHKPNPFQRCKNEALPIGVCRDHAHRCRKPDCAGLAVNTLCPEHECASEGCVKQRAGHGNRCIKHGCEHMIQSDGVSMHCGNVREWKAKYCSEHVCADSECRELHRVGPYCRQHGCIQKLEDDFCGRVRKAQNSYHCVEHACARADCGKVRERNGQYCASHTCDTSGCIEQCVGTHQYCESHECAYETCHQGRGVGKFCKRHGCVAPEDGGHCGGGCRTGSSFCERHVCAKKSCLDASSGRGECCSKHGCAHQDGGVACCVMREEGSDYCKNHSCAIEDCGYQRDGKECCKYHGCKHTEPGKKEKCSVQKENGSDYCISHACAHPGCGKHRGVGSLCGKHGCAFKADGKASVVCGELRKDGKWCITHACAHEGCKNANNGTVRCCIEHGCVHEVRGGRCGNIRVPGRELCAGHAYPRKRGLFVAGDGSQGLADPAPTEDKATAADKAPSGTPYEATKSQLEKLLVESGIGCEVFGEDGVTWADVIGLDYVKEAIRIAMVYPSQEPDMPEGAWANGILLFGPPGTGKTLVSRVAANEIKGFMVNVNAASVIDKYYGGSEKNVENLFRIATKYADETGKPVVLFIDEADTLLGSFWSETSHVAQTKTAFQTNMNTIKAEKKRVYVIGTTNKPDRLDDAFIRRFQKRIYVELPSPEDRENLFRLHAKVYRVGDDVDFGALARLCDGYSSSEIKNACDAAFNNVLAEEYALSGGGRPGGVSGRRRKPLSMKDFRDACLKISPAVNQNELAAYKKLKERYESL